MAPPMAAGLSTRMEIGPGGLRAPAAPPLLPALLLTRRRRRAGPVVEPFQLEPGHLLADESLWTETTTAGTSAEMAAAFSRPDAAGATSASAAD